MNHSDEVSGAVVGMSAQVAQKGVETAQHLVDKTVDNIAKLLQAMFKSGARTGNSPTADVTSSNMTDIKSGEVGIKELVADAKKNGDTIVSTDGYSKADTAFIAKKASEYGIPVSFTGKENSDNICSHVRGCDKPMFERICTELMQSKIKTKPDVLDNFKAERWEIDGIQRELSKHDLNANWGRTQEGEYFCLFEKADSKAIKMARNEFLRKCNELEHGLEVSHDDDYYTITDTKTGKTLTFDTAPSRSELSEMFQTQFGYDENKAEIACGKFGESLEGEVKAKFFGNNPQNEFAKIENHVALKGENILVKDYDCLRLTPKADAESLCGGVPCLVFRDSNNNFAVLNPEKMTRVQMAETIRESLGIEDDKTVTALVDKAERVNDYYVKQNDVNFVHNCNGGADNEIEIHSDIERQNKNEFHVKTNGAILILSLSDKKTALTELQAMYREQGLSEDSAKQAAKAVFLKAQSQSAEKVMHIEEIRAVHLTTTVTIRHGSHVDEVELGNEPNDREKALADLMEKFGVCEEEAELLLSQADDRIGDNADVIEKAKKTEKPLNSQNGHERTPAPSVNVDVKADDVPEVPQAPAPKRR